MKDITTREDLVLLVTKFYETATVDPLLKNTFDSFIDKDVWDVHVDKIINFWSMVIFKNNDYSGNMFAKHIPMKLTVEQIDRWVELFVANLDNNFKGPNTEEALSRVHNMGIMFKSKIEGNSGFRSLI
jgi:hemoglobin